MVEGAQKGCVGCNVTLESGVVVDQYMWACPSVDGGQCKPINEFEPTMDFLLFTVGGCLWIVFAVINVFNALKAARNIDIRMNNLIDNNTIMRSAPWWKRWGKANEESMSRLPLQVNVLLAIGGITRSVSFLVDPWGNRRVILEPWRSILFRFLQVILVRILFALPIKWNRVVSSTELKLSRREEYFLFLGTLICSFSVILDVLQTGFGNTLMLATCFVFEVLGFYFSGKLLYKLAKLIDEMRDDISKARGPSALMVEAADEELGKHSIVASLGDSPGAPLHPLTASRPLGNVPPHSNRQSVTGVLMSVLVTNDAPLTSPVHQRVAAQASQTDNQQYYAGVQQSSSSIMTKTTNKNSSNTVFTFGQINPSLASTQSVSVSKQIIVRNASKDVGHGNSKQEQRASKDHRRQNKIEMNEMRRTLRKFVFQVGSLTLVGLYTLTVGFLFLSESKKGPHEFYLLAIFVHLGEVFAWAVITYIIFGVPIERRKTRPKPTGIPKSRIVKSESHHNSPVRVSPMPVEIIAK